MVQKLLLSVIAILAALVVGLALFWHPDLPERPLPKAALPVGDFTLQSADGPVSLKDFRGRLVLVYFGYTYCPDICPTALSATAEALRLLTPEEKARLAVLFVSVDPERDTPARLKEYGQFFDPIIVGMTGTPEVLSEIARRYGVFYARQPAETAGGGYVVDHTSDIMIVDAAGALAGKIAHGTAPQAMADEIRKRLNSH